MRLRELSVGAAKRKLRCLDKRAKSQRRRPRRLPLEPVPHIRYSVPVKRHRGEPGHTRDTRDTRAHAVQYRNNGDRNVRGGTVPPSRRRPADGYLFRTFPAHEVPRSPSSAPRTTCNSNAMRRSTDPRARAPHERQRACAACSTKISPATHKALGRVRVVLAPGRRRELRPQGQLGG